MDTHDFKCTLLAALLKSCLHEKLIDVILYT